MLTLAAPWALAAGAVASAVVLGLHLLAWRRPAPTPLPTARFAPPSAVRAVSRDLRLSDRLLLLVRVAVLLLAGLALARPAWTPVRSGTARVFVLDASRRVARVGDVADSARALSAGAAVTAWVRVDSVARLLSDTTLGPRAAVRGALGAGLVAAVREAVRLARVHDTVEVVVVSPLPRRAGTRRWTPCVPSGAGRCARYASPPRSTRQPQRASTAPARRASSRPPAIRSGRPSPSRSTPPLRRFVSHASRSPPPTPRGRATGASSCRGRGPLGRIRSPHRRRWWPATGR
ncbi:MAG: BatA domain-containing protein [Gemmatimonadetes bacterium]|nr:BatA domain-containing protein [Gemmatimonadota bacterium]